MSISQLARSIAESPTLALNEQARLLRERGEAVIHLGAGEPKNRAPINAILSSAAKLNTGDVKYTPTEGIPSLRKAIIRYTEENYDRIVAPENVLVSAGAKQALFNLLFTLVNPQEEVIVLAPYWVSYPEMIKMVYGVPVIVTPEDGKFVPRMEDIERAVSSYTKAIIVNSPNNPSGVIYPAELIGQLVEFCERKGIYLIMDDIYHRLVFDGKRAASAYSYTTKDLETTKVISINGISKLYGMTGLPDRLGRRSAEDRGGHDQRAGTDHVLHLRHPAGRSRRCAHRTAERGGNAAHDTGEQPECDDAGAAGVQRHHISRRRTGPTTVCPISARTTRAPSSSPQFLLQEGPRRHRPGQGVRHGRPSPAELCHDDQGHQAGHRADQVGARPVCSQ